MLLFTTSCSDDGFSESDIKSQYPKPDNPNVTVESVSLEELNKIFEENGLSTYTQERVDKISQKLSEKGNLYCPSLLIHADWNGNDTVSVIDIVLAKNFIRMNDDGGYAVDPTTCCGHPGNVIDFGYLTAIYSFNEPWRLDQDDLDVGVITVLYC